MGKIDQMDRNEVMAEIRRIQQEFPQLVEATQPTIDANFQEIEVHPNANTET